MIEFGNEVSERHAIELPTLHTIKPSPFVPVPSDEMIRYLSGMSPAAPRKTLRYDGYLISGLILASDVYNVAKRFDSPLTRENYQIVDIGCGCGRVASFLTQLMPDCRYLGVDVWGDAIEWAQQTLTPSMPNLEFAHLGKSNQGYQGFTHYTLPIEDESTSLVVGMSLFTHLDEAATLGYFREIARVLDRDGLACLTYNHLDSRSIARIEQLTFDAGHTLDKTNPDFWFRYIADGDTLDTYFSEKAWNAAAEQAGLEVVGTRRGYHLGAVTVGPHNIAAGQDLSVLRRAR